MLQLTTINISFLRHEGRVAAHERRCVDEWAVFLAFLICTSLPFSFPCWAGPVRGGGSSDGGGPLRHPIDAGKGKKTFRPMLFLLCILRPHQHLSNFSGIRTQSSESSSARLAYPGPKTTVKTTASLTCCLPLSLLVGDQMRSFFIWLVSGRACRLHPLDRHWRRR